MGICIYFVFQWNVLECELVLFLLLEARLCPQPGHPSAKPHAQPQVLIAKCCTASRSASAFDSGRDASAPVAEASLRSPADDADDDATAMLVPASVSTMPKLPWPRACRANKRQPARRECARLRIVYARCTLEVTHEVSTSARAPK